MTRISKPHRLAYAPVCTSACDVLAVHGPLSHLTILSRPGAAPHTRCTTVNHKACRYIPADNRLPFLSPHNCAQEQLASYLTTSRRPTRTCLGESNWNPLSFTPVSIDIRLAYPPAERADPDHNIPEQIQLVQLELTSVYRDFPSFSSGRSRPQYTRLNLVNAT